MENGASRLPAIGKIIAIASGKGGVGKSTVAVNLALSLSKGGARVGILDADIYGPSQPHLLGVADISNFSPPVNNRFQPVLAHGLKMNSIGYLVPPGTPMIWRGPMVTQALQQLLFQTDWDTLDYLIIDMPPGTGDVHLTLSQHVPLSGAVIVTTPQELSLIDARKGLRMFEKVEVPVLGIVENMNGYVCPNCDSVSEIFGSGAGAVLAAEAGVNLLGSLPLDPRIQTQSDSGVPITVAEPDGQNARLYLEIAREMKAALHDTVVEMPNIEMVD